MRGTLMVCGLLTAAMLSGAWSKTAVGQDEKVYDLRGPAPEKGQVFHSEMRLKITNADTILKVAGQTLNLKMTMDMIGEEESKVLAVDGRTVTKSQSKILKERAEVTVPGVADAKTESTELEGKIVISTLTEDGKTKDGKVKYGKWKHSLVDDRPTEKQKKELDNRNGIENEDELYPAEKVKVGHEWKVEAKALTKLFGNSFTDISGELKQKFLKIENVDGEECAVIESVGPVKGKMKDEDGEPTLNVEMDLKAKAWRSIKTGVELKGTFSGTIKLAGTVKMDDMEVNITLSGPMTGESKSKLVK